MRSDSSLDCGEGGRYGEKRVELGIYFEGRVKWTLDWIRESKESRITS